MRLTALDLKGKKVPGMYADGDGLYLRVTAEGTKNWVLRYMLAGKPHWMGLGSVSLFGLAEARARALDYRKQRYEGIDPIAARRATRRKAQLEAAKAVTFKTCAERYIAAHKAGWRNEKHASQWAATLDAYAYRKIGALSVQLIDTGHVMSVIEPIWSTKPETASRLRGRIEAVLDWSKVHGYRDGENPARWKGHLANLLPARGKVAKAKHHPALSWRGMGSFMTELREQRGVAAKALEFTILTAARTNETIGARWQEIDTGTKVWTIPAGRMKAGQEHRIPLSADAVAVLTDMARLGTEGYVFKSGGAGLSNMAMLMLLQEPDRMNHPDLTVHGFRSTFRDWAAETGKPADIAEAALAHSPGDKTVQAYQRGDLLDRRRKLMTDWALFCRTPYVERGNSLGADRERTERLDVAERAISSSELGATNVSDSASGDPP